MLSLSVVVEWIVLGYLGMRSFARWNGMEIDTALILIQEVDFVTFV